MSLRYSKEPVNSFQESATAAFDLIEFVLESPALDEALDGSTVTAKTREMSANSNAEGETRRDEVEYEVAQEGRPPQLITISKTSQLGARVENSR